MVLFPGIVSSADWNVTQRSAGANMSVDIAGGQGYVAGSEALNQGFYHCVSDSTVVNKAVSAASATQTRKDCVIARVFDSFYSGATDAWQFEIVTGTPGSGVEPAIPVNSYKIATIDVAINATSIINANLTSRRTYAATTGAVRPVASQAARDALTPRVPGLEVYRSDIRTKEIWDGTTWYRSFDPALNALDTGWLGLTLNLGGSAGSFIATTNYPLQYRKIGNRVSLRGMVTWNAHLLTDVITTLPVGARPSYQAWLSLAIGSGTTCVMQPLVGPGGGIQIPSASYWTGVPDAPMAIPLVGSFLVD
jgi:hypothetical protein